LEEFLFSRVRVQPRNRTSRRYIVREVLQGIGLCDHGGWLSSLKFIGQAIRKGNLEVRTWGKAAVHRRKFFYFREKSTLFLSPSNN
jgi:hypothetical protein